MRLIPNKIVYLQSLIYMHVEGLWLKIAAALAPAIVIAIMVVRKDKNRPEPTKWLMGAVGMGVLVAFGVILLSYTIIPDIPQDTYVGAFLSSFFNAAIPEEGLKFLALYILAKKCRHFDEVFDGIVYAVCIGMGFAGFENILYLFGADEGWLMVGIARALLAVPAHYFFAVIMGSFFALAWFDKHNRTVCYTAALAVPILVHGIYDTLCFSMGLDEAASGIILIVFILGFRYIQKFVKRLSVSMLRLDEMNNYSGF